MSFIVFFSKNNKQIFEKVYTEFEMAITQLEQLQKNNFQTFLQIN
jgi:hypothetical protein